MASSGFASSWRPPAILSRWNEWRLPTQSCVRRDAGLNRGGRPFPVVQRRASYGASCEGLRTPVHEPRLAIHVADDAAALRQIEQAIYDGQMIARTFSPCIGKPDFIESHAEHKLLKRIVAEGLHGPRPRG